MAKSARHNRRNKRYFENINTMAKRHAKKGFIGLIPFVVEVFIRIFYAIGCFFSYFSKILILICFLAILFFSVKYGSVVFNEIGRIVQEIKWDESPEELKNKDYLLSTEWGVCYQEFAPQKKEKICLRTRVAFLEYGVAWKVGFERDERGNVNIMFRAYRFGGSFFAPAHRVLFIHHPDSNYRREVLLADNRKYEPFTCDGGKWYFTKGSEHRKAISYLKVDPKVVYYGRNCPKILITFFKL